MARHALLIGVSAFDDNRLARLNAPTNDVLALRGVLQDSSRGGFDTVDLSIDEDFLQVRDRVSRFFHDKAPDDLLFLYYSGHGILGRNNRLYLATAGSNLDAPRERSLAAKEIREFIDESRARQQVVVLDCCHSGAFAEYAKSAGATPAVTADTFAGGDAGLYVLTAADALQYAWDGAELRTGAGTAGGANGGPVSRFTSWLVAGLQKGEAAPEEEAITMDDLYAYLFRRAKEDGAPSTPQRFVHGGVGDLKISGNPQACAGSLDPTTAEALASTDRLRRLGAVIHLERLLRERTTKEARAARFALRQRLRGEHEHDVREAILAALQADAAAAQGTANPRSPEAAPQPAPVPPADRAPRPATAPRPAPQPVPAPPVAATPSATVHAKPWWAEAENALKVIGAIVVLLFVLSMCSQY
jgi:hypothetical protein